MSSAPEAAARTTSGAPTGGSVAYKQAGNNEHMLALQRSLSTRKTGAVKIDYFGHCAFRITSPGGLTMMFDPWRNDPSGAWGAWFPKDFPRTVADIAISTHSLGKFGIGLKSAALSLGDTITVITKTAGAEVPICAILSTRVIQETRVLI